MDRGGRGVLGLSGAPQLRRFLAAAPITEPGADALFEDHQDLDEATRLSRIEGGAAMERTRHPGPSHDERTRAVNIRSDPSISDIDWDID